MEQKIEACLLNNQIPFVYGGTGSGKTTIVKKTWVQDSNCYSHGRKKWHLYCPFDIGEFEAMVSSVENNPNQRIVLDNLEALDAVSSKNVLQFITKKKKTTKLILIAIDPYDVKLRSIRSKAILCAMPQIQKSRIMSRAEDHGASTDSIDMLAKSNFQDYRLIRNIILDKCNGKYDATTNLALRNPFKAFSWLLGEQSKANLPTIVESDPFFYSMGVFTNYPKVSDNIEDIEKISEQLSDVDAIGYDCAEYQNTLLGKLNIKQKKRSLDVAFPNFTNTHKQIDKRWKSYEHMDMIEKKIRSLNLKSSKENTAHMKQLVSSYNLNQDVVDKAMKELGASKTLKPKAHIRRALENK